MKDRILGTFRNKYLAVLATILLAFSASGQVVQENNSFGMTFKRVQGSIALGMPVIDTTATPIWVGELRLRIASGDTSVFICKALTGQKWKLIGGSASNIYTANGTLTGNRTVTLGTNTLTFSGGSIAIASTVFAGQGKIDVQPAFTRMQQVNGSAAASISTKSDEAIPYVSMIATRPGVTSSIRFHSDSIHWQSPKYSYDPGMDQTLDSASFKPLAINPITGEQRQAKYWFGTGAASDSTFLNNGLSVVSGTFDTIQLGGSLIKNTTISGAFDLYFNNKSHKINVTDSLSIDAPKVAIRGIGSTVDTSTYKLLVRDPATGNVKYAPWLGGGGGGTTDHGALTGLSDDDHTQYLLLAGRGHVQTANGGTASGDSLKISSTSNATKGTIGFGGAAYIDEANKKMMVGAGTTTALNYVLQVETGNNADNTGLGIRGGEPDLVLNQLSGGSGYNTVSFYFDNSPYWGFGRNNSHNFYVFRIDPSTVIHDALIINRTTGYVSIDANATNSPTAILDLGASTTGGASLRLRDGSAPTSPNNGDVWNDGTHLKVRLAGTTYQLDQQGGSSPLTTLGDLIYEDATPTPTRLAGNTTTTKKFLTQTGTGSVSAAPAWGTLVSGDIPDLSATYIKNQSTVQTGSQFYVDGQSRIDNELLINTVDIGAYKLQVNGGFYNKVNAGENWIVEATGSNSLFATYQSTGSGATGFFIKTGDGASLGAKFSYVDFWNYDATEQRWDLGTYGTNNFTLRDRTNSKDALVVTANTGNIKTLYTGSGSAIAQFDASGNFSRGIDPAKIVSSIATVTTDVGNIGAGEDNLQTVSIPAGQLAADGDYIEFEFTIFVATNGNAKTLNLYFGSDNISTWSTGGGSLIAGTTTLRGKIIRTGAATQEVNITYIPPSGSSINTIVGTTAQTLSGAITLKTTGTAVSDNDIISKTLTVKYFPH
jgi:hypothetical protein